MKKLLLKSESGFTLVELMVVVAIIGILSAIAVPNFKKYQAKSKQSEAKIQLAALYQTEISAQADYNTFASCIKDLGYEPAPRGYYLVGFTTVGSQNGIISAAPFLATCGTTGFYEFPGGGQTDAAPRLKVIVTAFTSATLPAAAVGPANTTAFVAGAAGSISTTGVNDQWTIDQTKNLVNVTQGF